MTMNNNNNIPSTEGCPLTTTTTSLDLGVMPPTHSQQRSVRVPLMSKGLSFLSHTINRKPVRRALTELGRNDRKHNSLMVKKLLTISTEQFKQKWNFDPIKMKPITESGSVDSDGEQKKYQWELVKQNKQQEQDYKDKKELERTVCSIVSARMGRKQTTLSTVAVELPPPAPVVDNAREESTSRIPQLHQQEPTVSSTTEESNRASSETQSITVTNNSNSSSSSQRPESITQQQEESRKRLTVDGSPAAVVPTVTSLTNNNSVALASRQSKITDFASHRKIVHGPAVKEDTDLQPPSKKPRLTC